MVHLVLAVKLLEPVDIQVALVEAEASTVVETVCLLEPAVDLVM